MRRIVMASGFVAKSVWSGGKKSMAVGGILVSVLLLATQLVAPTDQSGPDAAKLVAPNMEARSRHVEKLEVPRMTGTRGVQVELTGWTTVNGAKETTIPAQGFYIATLGNGVALTTIDGEEKVRRAGEMWAVQDGQSMKVKIQGKRQESVVIHIFPVRPGR